jgi:hypothetical protein
LILLGQNLSSDGENGAEEFCDTLDGLYNSEY